MLESLLSMLIHSAIFHAPNQSGRGSAENEIKECGQVSQV